MTHQQAARFLDVPHQCAHAAPLCQQVLHHALAHAPRSTWMLIEVVCLRGGEVHVGVEFWR